MRVVVREGKDGKFYVRFTSANNEPWFISEGYSTRANAHRSFEDFTTAIALAMSTDGFTVIDE